MPRVISKSMKKYVFFLVSFFLLIAFFVFKFFYNASDLGGPHVRIGSALFSVEIADTEQQRERGLGNRDALCDTCGMLFLFDSSGKYAFWMKDMRFPLDILWIRDGKIVHIERNVDFRNQYKVYHSEQPADRVLEVNAGICTQWSIQEGDMVALEQ